MSFQKSKIRKIEIDANKGVVNFTLMKELKLKKVTSTWIPKLLGLNPFSSKGEELLNFWGILEKKEFDNYYSLRGAVAEELLQKILEGKGYTVSRYEAKENDYDYFKYDNKNPLYKYFGGLPDIVAKKDDEVLLCEVKSKELQYKKYVDENPPQTEIMQGKILGLLYGLDKTAMVWFLFDDDIARKMKNIVEEVQPYDTQKAVELYLQKHGYPRFKIDYDIIRKDYDIDKKELLEEMKKAYKYAETFRQTLKIDIKDLDSLLFNEILELQKEISNE
ncbi:hypothetical protein [Methanoculleus sp.]|uniref:hypothetical protein n=1 Tax=Methanoculleus sp. TaxID=90427 RepID=UPI0025DE0F52|nr:hypothetical protein [Methanoculleus sp.]MCK9319351.1 hypothetical protein [Methanoculleus sp.]